MSSVETMAAIFGMSVDDIVKIIGALGAASTIVLGAATKMLIALRGARRRSFIKIKRIEDIVEILAAAHCPDDPLLNKLINDMIDDQRPHADEKDAGE